MSSTNANGDEDLTEISDDFAGPLDLAESGIWPGPAESDIGHVGEDGSDFSSAGYLEQAPAGSRNIDTYSLIAASIGAACMAFIIGRLLR